MANTFYRGYYQTVMFGLLALILLIGIMCGVVMYQVVHRPLPQFFAVTTNGKQMQIAPNDQPNLLSTTIIKWASKAAVLAYTFDFVNYNKQIGAVRPFFTDAGWRDYQASISKLLQTIAQNQLFVNGVVSGTPVISNQGDYPGRGYVWRIQLPFLVTYQSANTTTRRAFTVIITILKVPTWKNVAGIGIDQFLML